MSLDEDIAAFRCARSHVLTSDQILDAGRAAASFSEGDIVFWAGGDRRLACQIACINQEISRVLLIPLLREIGGTQYNRSFSVACSMLLANYRSRPTPEALAALLDGGAS